jgi:secondary thiamine-phosphate synthase enzyme
MPTSFTVTTRRRGFYDVTARVQRLVAESGVREGLCTVFVHHTSASVIVCENADPAVQRDLQRFFDDLAPDGDPRFTHTAEGPDDMSAHVRSVLTQASLALPVSDGRCDLGTWQGVYLWEHRHEGSARRLSVTVVPSPSG